MLFQAAQGGFPRVGGAAEAVQQEQREIHGRGSARSAGGRNETTAYRAPIKEQGLGAVTVRIHELWVSSRKAVHWPGTPAPWPAPQQRRRRGAFREHASPRVDAVLAAAAGRRFFTQ